MSEVSRWAALFGGGASPTGKTFAAAGDDNTVRTCDVDYNDTRRFLCAHWLSDFIAAKRKQYNINDSAATCSNP